MAFSISDVLAIVQNGVTAVNNLAKQVTGSFTNILAQLVALQAQTAGYEAAWTAYTPAVTASVGTFTTVSSSGRYKQNGKTVFFTVSITITTNGTAATGVVVAMPVTAQAARFSFVGREQAVLGISLIATLTSTTLMLIKKYDNTYPGADGYLLNVCGSYEAA